MADLEQTRIPAPERTPSSHLAETGVSSIVSWGGFLDDGERDQALTGSNKYLTYSNILANVSIVAAGVRYFLNLVSRPQWKVEAPKGVPGAERYAELVESMMYDRNLRRPWTSIVKRAATFPLYGFSIQEWTAYLRKDGVIGMLDIAPRPQSTIYRWDVSQHGEVFGASQLSPNTAREIYIPRWKMVYVVDDSLSDSPEGLGLFRHVAESARRLRRYEQLEGWGYETDLRGVPVGRAPLAALRELLANNEITQADYDAALLGLRNFLRGHVKTPNQGIMLDSITYEDRETRKPSGELKWNLELLRAEATSHPELLRSIERVNREIARILGVEQLLLGDNGVGSFAMAKEKNHNFAIVIDSTLEKLREVFEKDWLGPIWRLNGWPEEAMPEIKTDRLQFRDIEQVTGALERLARAGATMMPDDPAINDIRDQMGLSHPITIPDAQLAAEAATAGAPSQQPPPQNAGSEAPPQ